MDILEKIQNYSSKAYDWKMRLVGTDQEPAYHGEGNVWIHTLLVVESLLSDVEYRVLNMDEQKVLLLAAILHDIAKPFCTKFENGKITSPNHAVKGEIEARKLMYKYAFMEELFGKLTFVQREQVCSLVRYHGLPVLFLEKSNTQRAVLKACLEVAGKYLYILAKADVRGRHSKSNKDNLETVDLFKEYTIENECFEKIKMFPNASGKLLYFKKDTGYMHYAPFEEEKFRVYLMSGIPASGKDTYIKTHLKNYPVVSLDDIRKQMGVDPAGNQGRVVQEAKAQAKKLLAKKESFVWNATNITEKMRTPLIDLFLDYDASVEIVYTETTYDQLLKRNALRERTVPEDVISRLADHLQMPKFWEAQNVRYVCDGQYIIQA